VFHERLPRGQKTTPLQLGTGEHKPSGELEFEDCRKQNSPLAIGSDLLFYGVLH
jgi:hypothetical protein